MKHIFSIITHACHCEGQSPRSNLKAGSGHIPQSLLWQTMIAVCVSFFAMTLLLFLPSVGFTESKEIISEGTYNMGDGETPTVAESRALLQAKRTALEEAGTYVESYSKVKDLKLTEDEIKVLASGLMEVEILDKKRTVIADGFHFWIKIKARVQTEKMEEMAKRVKEKDVIEDYKRIQEAYDKRQKEIEELKKQLAQAKGEKEKKQIKAKVTGEEKLFQANERFEKKHKQNIGKVVYNKYTGYPEGYITQSGEYTFGVPIGVKEDDVFDKYDQNKKIKSPNTGRPPEKSLSFTNEDLEKYNTAESKEHDKAIEANAKAIALNPNDDYAYYNRGIVYYGKGRYDRAIEDYNKAIALNPNNPYAYYNRGIAYVQKSQYDRAIEDYNKAIALNPNYAYAYNNRGIAYVRKGQYGRAISDFQKACDLGDEMGCKNLK